MISHYEYNKRWYITSYSIIRCTIYKWLECDIYNGAGRMCKCDKRETDEKRKTKKLVVQTIFYWSVVIYKKNVGDLYGTLEHSSLESVSFGTLICIAANTATSFCWALQFFFVELSLNSKYFLLFYLVMDGLVPRKIQFTKHFFCFGKSDPSRLIYFNVCFGNPSLLYRGKLISVHKYWFCCFWFSNILNQRNEH